MSPRFAYRIAVSAIVILAGWATTTAANAQDRSKEIKQERKFEQKERELSQKDWKEHQKVLHKQAEEQAKFARKTRHDDEKRFHKRGSKLDKASKNRAKWEREHNNWHAHHPRRRHDPNWVRQHDRWHAEHDKWIGAPHPR